MTTSVADRKKLWSKAGGECSFKECKVRGEGLMEAHIVARQDGGPRAEPSLAKKDGDRYENLILLCPNHHYIVVDRDPEEWTVETLHRMKKIHEDEIATRGERLTEFQGSVEAKGTDADSVTGAKVTRPTRFGPGTSIRAKGERVRKITGLQIGSGADE